MFSNFLTILTNASDKSGGMFQRGTFDFQKIGDMFMRLLWTMICGIIQILYSVEQAFYWLAGINRNMTYSNDGKNSEKLDSLFPTIDLDTGKYSSGTLFGDSNLLELTKIMLLVGAGMIVFFLLFAIIKGLFNNEGKTEVMIKSATWNTLKACIFMALAPAMIIITLSTILWFLNLIFQGVFNTLVGVDGNISIAESILESCYTGEDLKGIFAKSVTSLGGFYGIAVKDKVLQPTGNAQLYIQFYDLETLIKGSTWNGFSDKAINMQLNGDFNYSIAFIGGIFSLVALGLMCIRIGERLFNLIIDYILSIPAIATMPYDNGQRFQTWGQMFLGQTLNFSGSVLAMAVYLFVVKSISGVINGITADHTELFKAVVLLVIIIGGAFTCVKAGTIVSQLIGSVASQQENNSLNQSMQLARMGASATKTATAVGLAGFGIGAIGGLKAMKNGDNTGSSGKGGSGGTGGNVLRDVGGANGTNKANVGEKLGESASAISGESPISNATKMAGTMSASNSVADAVSSATENATGGAESILSGNSKGGLGVNTMSTKASNDNLVGKSTKTTKNALQGTGSAIARSARETMRMSRGNVVAMGIGLTAGTLGAVGGTIARATGKGIGKLASKGADKVGIGNEGRNYRREMKNTEKSLMKGDLSTLKGMKENSLNELKHEHMQKVNDIKNDQSLSDEVRETKLFAEDQRYGKAQKETNNFYNGVGKEIKDTYQGRIKANNNLFNNKDSEGNSKGDRSYIKQQNAKDIGKAYHNSQHHGLDVKGMVDDKTNLQNKNGK